MERVPRYSSGREDLQNGGNRRHNSMGRKHLRILVVHDFDLKSAAKLAESSLLSSNNIRNHRSRSKDPLLEKCVDLCIAVNTASEFSAPDGLYDPDDELFQYYKGQTRRTRMLKTTTISGTARNQMRLPYNYTYNGTEARHLRGRPRIGKKALTPSYRSVSVPVPLPPPAQPVFYDSCENDNIECEEGNETSHLDSGQLIFVGISPEERAARRGLVTAALSQLESIVCRVAYVLKDEASHDGKSQHVHLRLTSNSLDIRNRWLPLVEGLGLAGLVKETERIQTIPLSSSPADIHDNDSSCGSSGDCPSVLPSAHRDISGSSKYIVNEHCNRSRMLEGLLRSAHPMRLTSKENETYTLTDEDPFTGDQEGPLFQSIVITEAHDSRKAPVKSEMVLSAAGELRKGESSKSEFVRDHLLLEIAAGSRSVPSSQSFTARGNASTTVIFPGSLRTRGEFCLVDLVLDDDIETEDMGGDGTNMNGDFGKPQRPFRWRVEETHFHRLESEQDIQDST